MKIKSKNWEWIIEDLEDGDVISVDYTDKLNNLQLYGYQDLALVYTKFSNGRTIRAWAYFDKQGKSLPEYAEDAYGRDIIKVPKKYHSEIKKWAEKYF